jgi:hypothetical protein
MPAMQLVPLMQQLNASSIRVSIAIKLSIISIQIDGSADQTDLYRRKRIGPRTEPWGTPQVSRVALDVDPEWQTHSFLLVRYDVSHCNTAEVSPKDCCMGVLESSEEDIVINGVKCG